MKRYTLPIALDEFNKIDENILIDMAALKFPTDDSKQKRSSFIFIRNTNLKANFDFSGCSPDDKEEFLLMYMKQKIDVDIPILTTSWIKILSYGYTDLDIPCILSNNEIAVFCKSHADFVYEMRRLSISLSICSIDYYVKSSGSEYDNDLERSDFNEIYMSNFIKMLEYEQFLNMIQFIDDIQPVYYNAYFIHNNYMGKIISKFPYLNLMNIMMSTDPNTLKAFTDNLEAYLNGNMEDGQNNK